jgi:hypothetical protein
MLPAQRLQENFDDPGKSTLVSRSGFAAVAACSGPGAAARQSKPHSRSGMETRLEGLSFVAATHQASPSPPSSSPPDLENKTPLGAVALLIAALLIVTAPAPH